LALIFKGPRQRFGNGLMEWIRRLAVIASDSSRLRMVCSILRGQIQREDTRFAYVLTPFNGEPLPSIPRNDLISGQRRIRISFDAKVIDASHTLRVLLKDEKEDRWLAEESRTVSSNHWSPIKIYFQIPPTNECRLRIDDLDVTKAPSSVQVRNFVLAEKTVTGLGSVFRANIVSVCLPSDFVRCL